MAESSVNNILSLLQAFSGKSGTTKGTTSGGTKTTQTQLSQDAMNAMLKSAMEGNQGLAAVSGAQNSAGLYNSSTNTMLQNDLLARLTAQVAEKGAPTVTTSTPSKTTSVQNQPGLGMTGVLGIGAASLLKSPIDKIIKGKSLSEAFGFGGAGEASSGGVGDSMSTAALSGWESTPEMSTAALSGWEASDTVDMASQAMSSVGDAAADSGSNFISDFFGGGGSDVATDVGADTAEKIVEDSSGWVVCTELNKQGRLPNRWYIHGAKEFATYDERGKQGYYIWAIPSTRYLRKYPQARYSKFLEVVFNARAEYLSARAGQKGARKTVLGAVTVYGLYALCWTLSRTIARNSQDWNSLYVKES